MIRRLAVLAMAGAIALSGCGGDDEQPTVNQTRYDAGQAEAKVETTYATPTQPAPGVPPSSENEPEDERGAAASQSAPKIEVTEEESAIDETPSQRQVTTPLRCLRRAGMKAREIQPGMWSGDDEVFIDGPYNSTNGAKASAASQSAAATALPGGRFVVSAALRESLDAEVDRVARCLDTSG